MQSLIREPNHNAVLRSDNVALRFFSRYGGTPLEWWSEPFPMVTNPFPGSGVSVAWETGQDPTQASANGLQENPICVFSDPASGAYNYYAHEYLFDGAGKYGVTGFLPDFWLSSEKIDDAIAPNPDGTDSGWRTKYQPGTFSNSLNTFGCPVIFQGSNSNWSGLFFPGNEMDGGSVWNERLRSYGQGRIAAKLNISLANADKTSFAGLLFRKTIPAGPHKSKHEAFAAAGLHLYIYRSGSWTLHKMNNGAAVQVAVGSLSKAARKKLTSSDGLAVEIRTHNDIPGHLEIYFDGLLASTLNITGCPVGPHACLFASTHVGSVSFSRRQFFHLGVKFDAVYSALPNATILSDLKIISIAPEPVLFYRGGLPGVFLNQQTFPIGNRLCAGLRDDVWHELEGIYLLSDFESFYAGNLEGTCGVRATFEAVEIDGIHTATAHLLASKRAINDEFVLGINPLSFLENVTPKAIQSMRVKTRWQTRK